MNSFFGIAGWFVTNWYFVLGVALSFIVAIGFLTFFRGFMLGLNQIFYIDGHEEHVDHARVHSTHGLVIMVQVFVIWVVIKMLASLVGVGHVNMALGFWILFVYSLVALWSYYMGFWPTKSGSGGH